MPITVLCARDVYARRTMVGRAGADREEDVGGDRPELRVEEPLHVVVRRLVRDAVDDARVEVREERPVGSDRIGRLTVLGHRSPVEIRDQAPLDKRREERGRPRFAGERDARVGAAVDPGTVADHVEVGVGVAVAGDERLAVRVHPERVPRSVRDVLHAAR